jgi:flagellar hook-associated protein 3 FlgL
MAMRITNNMVSDRVMADLQARYAALATSQTQISTGSRVNAPSDDPTAAGQARLRASELSGIKASQDSVASTSTRLTATETSLEDLRSVLNRVKELALGAANGSMSQADRNASANEIEQLIQSAKDAMSTQINGSYLFSGTASDRAPYSTATGDTYQGDNGAIVRDAGAGVTLQVNPSFVPVNGTPATATTPISAGAILGSGSASGDGRVLDTLTQLVAHLRGGTAADLAAVSGTDLASVQRNLDGVSTAVSAVGAMLNRATAAASRLSDLEDGTNQSLDDLTGIDLAKAITDYSTQSSAYQASLKVGAQIIQPSLLQFLS